MKRTVCIVFGFIFILISDSAAIEPTPEKILWKVDEVRSPQQDFSVKARLISQKPGKEDKNALYEIWLKGRNKTIVKTLKPKIDRGTTLLMLKYDLWVFMTHISKPLRISLHQRLFGEVANGDIARVNFSGDYTPVLDGVSEIKGKTCYVLSLTANDERVTYNKAKLWVLKDNFYPLKTEFYAFSGKLLKTCFYVRYRDMAGGVRPTRLILVDPLVKGKQTIIDYADMQVESYSNKIFTKQYLKKFKY
jgi:outer membrane lipoprotein-sorting protein